MTNHTVNDTNETLRSEGCALPDLTAIDLFAGAGGMSLGLERSGFSVLAAVEFDSVAAATYTDNHPTTRVIDADVRTIDPNRLMADLGLEPGGLDLLAACPPCQGFSTHRTRNRTESEDERNDLVLEVARFATAMQPRAIVVENVPGLAGDSRLARLTATLQELGYATDFGILNVADFGVPQRRKRLVLVAVAKGEPTFPVTSVSRPTVRDALAGLASPKPEGQDPLHDYIPRRSERVAKLIRRIPADGGSRSDLGEEAQLDCHKRLNGYHDVYGRMAWDKVAPTITGGCTNPSKGRYLHPEQDRAITLREAAILQSFPPDYRFSLAGGRGRAALMIGNAVPPVFAEAQARAIAGVLGRTAVAGEDSS